METKKCSKCQIIKPLNKFYKDKFRKDGYTCQCKKCRSEYFREYHRNNIGKFKKWSKEYYQINCKEILKDKNEYYRNNLEKVKKYRKKYYKNDSENQLKRVREYRKNNPEKVKEAIKKWNKNNPERVKEIRRKASSKRDLIPKYRISKNIKTAINLSLKGNKNGRHWEDLVNFNLRDLMGHLECLFKEDMNWENYGHGGWEIDHRKPISSFSFNSCEDENFKKCWSLENLQPLWFSENRSKGNKII